MLFSFCPELLNSFPTDDLQKCVQEMNKPKNHTHHTMTLTTLHNNKYKLTITSWYSNRIVYSFLI